jgi:hypothetical protein
LQDSFRTQLAELRAELAALSAEKVEIPVEDSGVPEALAEVRRVRIDLDAIARNPVKFQARARRQAPPGRADQVVLAELEALDGETVNA